MNILSGNLAEGKTESAAPSLKQITGTDVEIKESVSTFDDAIRKKESENVKNVLQLPTKEVDETQISDEQVHIFLRFTFTMESFIIDLSTNERSAKLAVSIRDFLVCTVYYCNPNHFRGILKTHTRANLINLECVDIVAVKTVFAIF